MIDTIKAILSESAGLKRQMSEDESLHNLLEDIIQAFIMAFQNDGKVLFCGNGGSAADAQHLAAEFSGRFYKNRPALFAEALHVNTSFLTAVANDYGYEKVFSRMIEAAGKENDILVALSTSGNSPNILSAIDAAREKKMTVIGMTGTPAGKMKDICDFLVAVPSSSTPRIQECHILVGHIICELVEERLFSETGTQ